MQLFSFNSLNPVYGDNKGIIMHLIQELIPFNRTTNSNFLFCEY